MAEKIRKIAGDQGNTLRIPFNDAFIELSVEQVNAIVGSYEKLVSFLSIERKRKKAQEEQEAQE